MKDRRYYSPNEWQHIALYTRKLLECVSKMFNRHYRNINGLQAYSKEPIEQIHPKLQCPKRETLLDKDYAEIAGLRLE